MEKQNVDNDYIELCKRILISGKERHDRTGTGTLSRFGERLDIDLKLGFPLLTTKKVFWKGVMRELLWFISGSVDSKELSKNGVHIWEGNSSREFLDSRGLKYEEGVIGPGYGWQWRNFGADFTAVEKIPSVYRGGVDQLGNIIEQIKSNPEDRRLIVSAWNPTDIPKMALPPCHILYQFYVDDGELSCQVYQRSVDVGLGLPFNIASYALLTHLVAHVTGLRVGRLIMCLGDTHIYLTHIAAIYEQIERAPKKLPQLTINADVIRDINLITEKHISLTNYDPHPPLERQMVMAI